MNANNRVLEAKTALALARTGAMGGVGRSIFRVVDEIWEEHSTGLPIYFNPIGQIGSTQSIPFRVRDTNLADPAEPSQTFLDFAAIARADTYDVILASPTVAISLAEITGADSILYVDAINQRGSVVLIPQGQIVLHVVITPSPRGSLGSVSSRETLRSREILRQVVRKSEGK